MRHHRKLQHRRICNTLVYADHFIRMHSDIDPVRPAYRPSQLPRVCHESVDTSNMQSSRPDYYLSDGSTLVWVTNLDQRPLLPCPRRSWIVLSCKLRRVSGSDRRSRLCRAGIPRLPRIMARLLTVQSLLPQENSIMNFRPT